MCCGEKWKNLQICNAFTVHTQSCSKALSSCFLLPKSQRKCSCHELHVFLPCRSQAAAAGAAQFLRVLLWLQSEEGSWVARWAGLDCSYLSPVTPLWPPLCHAWMGQSNAPTRNEQDETRSHPPGSLRWASDSPAGVVNRSPVVAVQLLDRETAVQKLGEQLSVSFTGTTMEREVFHPLSLPAGQFFSYLLSLDNQRRIIKKLHI